MTLMNIVELRIAAGLSRRRLAGLSEISTDTIKKMEEGVPVRDYIAQKVIDKLNERLLAAGKLEERLALTDIDNLKIVA